MNRTLISIILLCIVSTSSGAFDPISRDDIQIIEGKDKTIYEYRNNGILLMMVPKNKKRKPYYMVPGDPPMGDQRVVINDNVHNF